MSANKIKAANLEEALRMAIKAQKDHEIAAKCFTKSAFLVALEENLFRFENGEDLEIDYSP